MLVKQDGGSDITLNFGNPSRFQILQKLNVQKTKMSLVDGIDFSPPDIDDRCSNQPTFSFESAEL